MKNIPVYQPYLRGNEKRYVNECLDTSWISSRGEFISKFEKAFCDFTKANFATTVANGTVALHLAIEALGIGAGDEVIVPTFTYIASVNTIAQTGAKPVFIDSLSSTLQLDPDDIIAKITPRTKAVMAVSLYGHPPELDKILDICKKYNLLLIEDCAEGFGSYYKGQHQGTFGDVATFSFFGNKTITTGEGGMVVFKNEEIYKKACHLKSQGVSATKEYWHDVLAYNYRMTNIQAAIGLAQIEQADEIIAKKRSVALTYKAALKDLPLNFHNEVGDVIHSYWMASIILHDPKTREPLRKFLKEKGIETRPFFYCAHEMPVFKSNDSFPHAELMAASGINLPSYPSLSGEELNYITTAINDFFEKKA